MAIKKIRDIVYGFISLDEQETEIVNHPIFQRLRRIKQLSLTDMVYPGASHTRFEHSIGVMQMASDMFDGIISKSEKMLETYDINKEGFKRYRKIIRLAALLHDVGHAPFSHAGEECMPLLPKSHPRFKRGENLRYEHEDYSIYIIKTIFRDLIENHKTNRNRNITVDEVTVLLGDENKKMDFMLLLFKGLISGQVDADRADYLLRDSIHLGVNYGLYDRNRLINSVALAKDIETEAPILAIEEGGWHVAESLVIARYQMFSQVYFHKVRRIYDHHIGQAVKAILNNGCYPSPDKKGIDKYIKYDDWFMNAKIKEGKAGVHGEIILNRKHYRMKHESQEILTQEDENKFNELIQQYRKESKNYFLDSAETSWYKLNKDICVRYDDGKVKLLSEISKVVKALNEDSRKKRLYVER